MSVVQVGIMRMAMPQWLMPVPVRMRLRHQPVMTVLMMQVMYMAVLVLKRPMLVFVIMPFGQVHP